MPVNFSELVYKPSQDLYGRFVTITPAGANEPYTARGILDVEAIDVQALDSSVFSETRIILDIRDAEFTTMPIQGDLIDIPSDGGLPAEGQFEVIDSDPNGGGETTLTLRRIVPAKP